MITEAQSKRLYASFEELDDYLCKIRFSPATRAMVKAKLSNVRKAFIATGKTSKPTPQKTYEHKKKKKIGFNIAPGK